MVYITIYAILETKKRVCSIANPEFIFIVTHTAPVRYLRVMMRMMCPDEIHIYNILLQYYNILFKNTIV